jgi:hypothetical protein
MLLLFGALTTGAAAQKGTQQRDTTVTRVMRPAGGQPGAGDGRVIVRDGNDAGPSGDPAETAANAFAQAFNAKDASVLEAYLKTHLSAEAVRSQSIADRVTAYRKMHHESGDLEVADIRMQHPNEASIVLGAPKSPMRIAMEIAVDEGDGRIYVLRLTPKAK